MDGAKRLADHLELLLEKTGVESDRALLTKLRNIEKIEPKPFAPHGEAEDVFIAEAEGQGEERWLIYKMAGAEKEWLGYQLDRVFNVQRQPAGVMRTLDMGQGMLSKFVEGQSGMSLDWHRDVSDDEVARAADANFLFGEMNGHEGQFIKGADGRLANIGRDRSFALEDDKLHSFPIRVAMKKKLPPCADIQRSAELFMASHEFQNVVADMFGLVFGMKDGDKRFDAMTKRIETYLQGGGIPANALPPPPPRKSKE